ncbi:MAG: hypothetical protein GY839_05815 [candidate division Zixibacteria bacterium]|nr:hypothetical protein [candidate division Zixibacteria bacterium]
MNKKIFKNPSWKIGGLLLAFALWFHLSTGGQFSREITVDIEYTNIPAGLMLSEDSQKSVQVEITTDGKRMFKILYFEELVVLIDLADLTRAGSYSIEFIDEQMQIPSGKSGIEIKYIAPIACDFEIIDQN